MCSSMPKPGDNSTEMVCSDDDISRRHGRSCSGSEDFRIVSFHLSYQKAWKTFSVLMSRNWPW